MSSRLIAGRKRLEQVHGRTETIAELVQAVGRLAGGAVTILGAACAILNIVAPKPAEDSPKPN